MTDDHVQSATLTEQAELLECLLPKVMRRLFALELDHPANELPISQLRVCTILQTGPRTLSALGDELHTSVSAVTQLADRLERAGFVERGDGEDRRVKLLRLTPVGAELMRKRRETRVARAAQALALLPELDRMQLICVVESLLEAATESAPVIFEDPLGARVQH